MHKLPFLKSQFIANSLFELVHSDIWGLNPINFVNGFKYYILFIDHYTRFTWIYFLENKSDVFAKFFQFKCMVEIQFTAKIKTFRSDGGGEFLSNAFKYYFS